MSVLILVKLHTAMNTLYGEVRIVSDVSQCIKHQAVVIGTCLHEANHQTGFQPLNTVFLGDLREIGCSPLQLLSSIHRDD